MSLLRSKQQEAKESESVKRGVVSFSLSEKEYSVSMELVREVIYARSVNPLPGAPDYFEGIIDLRGTVIPVIHLGKRLQVESSKRALGETVFEHILIMEIDHKKVGFIVDRVLSVIVIEKEAVQPAQNLIELPLSAIEGVFQYHGRLVILLSLERLFMDDTLQKVTEAIQYQKAARGIS